MNSSINKRLRGQFFTVVNPFLNDVFMEWWNQIPKNSRNRVLEPFAGANNIVEMIKEAGIKTAWECFDIEPVSENRAPEFTIRQRDTLEDFPFGCKVAVTNPPYLARNSAARRKMESLQSTRKCLKNLQKDMPNNGFSARAKRYPINTRSFLFSEK